MKITFWQNIVSIHQVPLLNALSNHKGIAIDLIVSESIPEYRKSLGWVHLENKKFNLIYLNDIKNPKEYISSRDFHIFSGFCAYKRLNSFFVECLKYNNVYIYSEGKDDRGLKGKLRLIKDKFNYLKYGKNVRGVFAIGDKGVSWYNKIGFKNKKIKKFGYFTDSIILESNFKNTSRYLFVGRLVESKGILNILEVFSYDSNKNRIIDIYGNGPLEAEVREASDNNININYKGVVNNSELKSELLNYDYLLLPNTGDEGWGAVINEALLSGLKIICSKNTGANCLVKASGFGIVLDQVNNNALNDALISLENLNINKDTIFQWSVNNISPEIGAKYFYSVLNNKEVKIKW
ncbi:MULTISPECIES: glycosyltransferase [unclassified Acinetobacter]|uniref:glycosyltransferase n=1 Tax=unclassified Acinetobacter TaxID=196816 RepID=UPI0015D1C6A2|nr:MULTISPECIES: glycosyltransferase [unclassified Acinetobacter]